MATLSRSLGRIARTVGVVVLARGAVRMFSLAITVLLADRLGAGAATDAFLLVRRLTIGLTEALRRVAGVIYIPPLVALMQSPQRGVTGRVWWNHMVRILGVALLGAFVVVLLAPWVIAVFAPGFDTERTEQATKLLRILVFMIPAGLVLATMTGLMFASRKFGLPEFARVFPRFLVVMLLLLLVPPLGVTILGWALLAGTVVVILALIPGLFSVVRATKLEQENLKSLSPGGAQEPASDLTASESPGLGLRGRTLPALLLLGAAQSAAWIDLAFASTQTVGGVSVLEYGYRIVYVLPTLLVSSLNTVMYTEFAHISAEHRAQPTTRDIAGYLRAGLFLLLPFVAFVWVAADAIVGLLLRHGTFSDEAAEMTALVIRLYVPSILFMFLRTSMMSRFFAEKAAPYLKVAGVVASVALLSRAGGAALLVEAIGIPGIALAASLSAGFVFLTLFFLLTRHWGNFIRAKDVGAIARMVASAAVSAGVMYGLLMVGSAQTGGLAGEVVTLALVATGGAISYLGTVALLRTEELSIVRAAMRRHRPRRSR